MPSFYFVIPLYFPFIFQFEQSLKKFDEEYFYEKRNIFNWKKKGLFFRFRCYVVLLAKQPFPEVNKYGEGINYENDSHALLVIHDEPNDF